MDVDSISLKSNKEEDVNLIESPGRIYLGITQAVHLSSFVFFSNCFGQKHL